MDKVAFCLVFCIGLVYGYAPLREPDVQGYSKGASFLDDVMGRMSRDPPVSDGAFIDFGSKLDDLGRVPGLFLPGRAIKDAEFMDTSDYDLLLGSGHVANRDQEYLQHSHLFGNKLISGGTAESSLKAKGQMVPTEVKSDAILPAYCNPPNPCPVDYTAEDGCIESHSFVNTAAFSRAYQASQDCMCDTEHMFDCPMLNEGDDTEMDFPGQLLNELQVTGQHKSLVAKKFYNKKSHEDRLSRLNTMAKAAAAAVHEGGSRPEYNPFLQGDKLPIAAKKGNHKLVS